MCWMLTRVYLILHDKNPFPSLYLAHQLSVRSKPTGPSFKTLKIQGYHTVTTASYIAEAWLAPQGLGEARLSQGKW